MDPVLEHNRQPNPAPPSVGSVPVTGAPGLTPIVVVAPRQMVYWVIAGLLAIIATILIVRDAGPPTAMAQTGMLGARGLFAFTGQIDQSKYGLWMLDVDAGTVWCYEYNPVKRRMKLLAGRTFRYDRYLENFNQDDETTPEIIEEILNQQRQSQMRHRNMASLGAASQPGMTGS